MNDEKIKKVRWDPIIAKLADGKLKQKICTDVNNHDVTSTSKVKGFITSLKRLSKEDFQTFLNVLFDPGGPKVKYQNPDFWRVHPFKKRLVKRLIHKFIQHNTQARHTQIYPLIREMAVSLMF